MDYATLYRTLIHRATPARPIDAAELSRRRRIYSKLKANVQELTGYDDILALQIADSLYHKNLGYLFRKPTAANEARRREYIRRALRAVLMYRENMEPELLTSELRELLAQLNREHADRVQRLKEEGVPFSGAPSEAAATESPLSNRETQRRSERGIA